MDDQQQQQQRINRAAQEFTDALVAAYRTTSESTAVAQQLGAQQVEYFFNAGINNLRTQAEDTSQVTQQLADQQQLAREATRNLTQVSFPFYQGGMSRTQRRAEEAAVRAQEAQVRAEEAERSRSEAESQRGEEEGDTDAGAVYRPLSQWVRTSGRSKVRGRNTRSRGRSSSRR
jgi:hypothetical protein